MYLDSAKKAELFEKHGKSAKDTGSPESQIALFTFRIAHLTGHLQKIDIERYRAIIKELGIRR